MKLFLQDGFHATSMTAIAEAAGIGRRTLFRYYATKEQLALALHDNIYDDLIETIDQHTDGADAAQMMMRSIVHWMRQFSVQLALDLTEILLTTPELQMHQLVKYNAIEIAFAKIARDRCGEAELSARVIAAAVIGAWRVAAQNWLDAGRNGHPINLVAEAFNILTKRFPIISSDTNGSSSKF